MAKNKTNSVKDVDFEEEVEEVEEVEEIKEDISDDEYEDDYEELTTDQRIINIEKRTNLTLILVIVSCLISLITLIVVASGGVSTKEETETPTEQGTSEYSYDTSAFKEIKGTDIKTESKNETIVIMIGRQGCYYCSQYAPVITAVAKEYGITIRYIDLNKMITSDGQTATIVDQESYDAIMALTGDGEWKSFASENFGYTPETLIIKNNKVVGGLVGSTDADATKAAFKNAGIKQK